jgi:hypothetical protein
MKLFQVRRLESIVLAAFVIAICTAASAFAQVNMVYLESNISRSTNKNSVYAYSNDGLGNLTQVAGSPFLTSGTGVTPRASSTGTPFVSDGQLTTNSGGAFLYAVNGHTDTIAAFLINSDGTLTTISGSPFASQGFDPVSMSVSNAGPAGNLLIAANSNNDTHQTGGTPNYTTFRLSPQGALTPVSGSTISQATGTMPSQALVNPGQLFAFGLNSGSSSSTLTCWSIGVGGKLVQNSQMTPPSPSKVFQGIANNPIFRTVYVGLPDVNEIAVYSYDSLCNLTFVRTVTDPGTGVAHLTVNAAGSVLYSSETTSTSVTAWDINVHQLTPTVLGTVTLAAGGAPSSLALDPTGAFLYVLAPNDKGVGSSGNFLHVLTVNSDGTLIETASPVSIPVKSTEQVAGLAVVQK